MILCNKYRVTKGGKMLNHYVLTGISAVGDPVHEETNKNALSHHSRLSKHNNVLCSFHYLLNLTFQATKNSVHKEAVIRGNIA